MNLQFRSTMVGKFPEVDVIQVLPDDSGESVAWFWKLRTAAAFIDLVNLGEKMQLHPLSTKEWKQFRKALKAIKKQSGKL